MEVVFSKMLGLASTDGAPSDSPTFYDSDTDGADSDGDDTQPKLSQLTIVKTETYEETSYLISVDTDESFRFVLDTQQKCRESLGWEMRVGMDKYDQDIFTSDVVSGPLSIQVLMSHENMSNGNVLTKVVMRLSWAGSDSVNIVFSNCHNGYYSHWVGLFDNGSDEACWFSFI
ncbi:hypothetical protein CL622_04240 [archaeon]|nr:hypothetical protein [archaeon]